MWIKICGIREATSAVEIARLGIDAVGLNFYERSPRQVAPDAAVEIVSRLPAGTEAVGVFVNQPVAEIVHWQRECGFQGIQLHGDESVEFLAELQTRLPHCRVYRALRIGPQGLDAVAEFVDACRRAGLRPERLLVDAHVAGSYGGTGRPVDWKLLAEQYLREEWPRLILAGGLTPQNVAEAVRTVRPWGVDVAGGVEESPGRKNVELVRRFLAAARAVQLEPHE